VCVFLVFQFPTRIGSLVNPEYAAAKAILEAVK
jgi:hypothetical protein